MKLRRKDARLFMEIETDEDAELLMSLHLKILNAHGWIDREGGRYLFMIYKLDNNTISTKIGENDG